MDENKKQKTSTWFDDIEGGNNNNNNRWFGGGKKNILFRGCDRRAKVSSSSLYDEQKPVWFIFKLPCDCLNQCFTIQQIKLKNKPHITNTMKMFNHTLIHPLPLHFELTYTHPVPLLFSELYDASWIVLGSTIYFFGGCSREIYYLKDVTGTNYSFSPSFESAGYMISKRKAPKVAALDGKVYVFGDSDDVFGEVFQPNLDGLEGRSSPISSPLPFSGIVQFVVAIEEDRKIIVGINLRFVNQVLVKSFYPDDETFNGTSIFVYDVIEDSWVRHTSSLFLNRESLLCQPIVVGSCLYWLGTQMWAYDLVTKQYFEGPIEDYMFQHLIETQKIDKLSVSLFHLTGDFFCITWVDFGTSTDLHCTTVQSLKTTTNLQSNRFQLRTTALSCQSFASDISTFLQSPALIL